MAALAVDSVVGELSEGSLGGGSCGCWEEQEKLEGCRRRGVAGGR